MFFQVALRKVESEPFPIELKSVLIHPKSHPLYELLIRGGIFCMKSAYDAFAIRLRFIFLISWPQTPPESPADRGGTSGRGAAKSSRVLTRNVLSARARPKLRSISRRPGPQPQVRPRLCFGASLVDGAARTPQETGPHARGFVQNRGPPDGGPPCGRALGNIAWCRLQEDGGGVPTAGGRAQGPRQRIGAGPGIKVRAQAPRAAGPPGFRANTATSARAPCGAGSLRSPAPRAAQASSLVSFSWRPDA